MVQTIKIIPKKGISGEALAKTLAGMLEAFEQQDIRIIHVCPASGEVVIKDLSAWGKSLGFLSEVLNFVNNSTVAGEAQEICLNKD